VITILFAALLGLPAAQQGSGAGEAEIHAPVVIAITDISAALPGSFERIRVALDTPVAIDFRSMRRADFRVEVTQDRHDDMLKALSWEHHEDPLAHVPLIQYNLGSLLGMAIQGVKDSRRASAQRAAQEEVRRALAEFCAVNDCSPASTVK
jgi:hypothetical protein